MGGPVVEGPLAGRGCLHGEAEEGDHGEARVLDLRQLQPLLLLRVRRQAQRVEVGSPRVQPLLRVQLRVALELDVPDHQHLDPDQRRDREGQRLPQVGRPVHKLHLPSITKMSVNFRVAVIYIYIDTHTYMYIYAAWKNINGWFIIVYLAGVLPGDASEPLDGESAEGGEHGPAAMDELALAEALEAEDLAVGLERGGLDLGGLEPGADDAAGLVLGKVLVQRVQVELQVLRGLAEPPRVEPVVAHVRPVKVVGRHRAGEPERPVGARRRLGRLLRGRRLLAEPEPGHDAPVLRSRVREPGAQECARRGGHRRSHGCCSCFFSLVCLCVCAGVRWWCVAGRGLVTGYK
ncbi:unnamed protein product [Urochloa decumbens]|uniref:Uncharacterized protein n=1 Tax=Urochloa decumbens TaxID=240449 RepID=A0ABC9ET94_9POAL